MRVIDAHVHFWDPARLDYPWLADLDALRRPYRPVDLVDAAGPVLDGAVFVEAGCRADLAIEELAWVAGLADRWPWIRGIIAHAPLELGAAAARHVTQLAEHPLVKGVRRNIQDEAPGFSTDAAFIDGVQLLARHDLTFDLCVRHHQLTEVTDLVARVPEVTFVLDHLGKPPASARALDPWRARLDRLAELPNVVCKLSGLATEADWARWNDDDVQPFLRHALAHFGPERCMYGGDWPVATLATSYQRWLAVVLAAIAHLPEPARDAVLHGTARRIYRLDD
jgi:L-fuconolactonase